MPPPAAAADHHRHQAAVVELANQARLVVVAERVLAWAPVWLLLGEAQQCILVVGVEVAAEDEQNSDLRVVDVKGA